MGPAVFTAGEGGIPARREGAVLASMGPAVFTAGETHGCDACAAHWRASMGPAVFTAGEVPDAAETSTLRVLQWGPRFSPRERTD